MAYDIRTRRLFQKGINSEQFVLDVVRKAQAISMASEGGKTIMSWTGEGDAATYQYSLPVDIIISEGIYFLMSYCPNTYGYIVTSARQIRY
jgi:hypothetical protein